MKTNYRQGGSVSSVLLILVLLAVAYFAFDMRVNDKGQLPVVSGGRAPDVDIRGPKVEVQTKSATVNLPNKDLEMQPKEVQYPSVSVELPKDTQGSASDQPSAPRE